jgi:hypothetical protein
MVKTGLLLGIMVFSLLIMPFADAQQFEKATFQESATIIYNQKFSESVIVSIGFETTSNDEIRISDETIEKINSNKKIKSVVFTNAGECVIGVTTEQQCIMINFRYEELRGDGGIRIVQESAKEMANVLIDNLNEDFRVEAKFHSVFIHMKEGVSELLKTSGAITGKGSVSVTYVTDKRATDFLFTDLAGTLIPKEIRDGGGFYNISEKMSKDDDSVISISVVRNGNSNLYMFKVAQEIKEKNIDVASINVLENFGIDEISRTDYFDKKNVPLNSVIHLVIIPDDNRKVNSISTHVITDLTKIENIMKKGWFLNSPAGEIIDLRFLFGETKTILAKELLVETAPWDMKSEMTLYSVEDIEEKIPETGDQSQYAVLALIILAGIGAAIFYLKGYKPKH